MRRSVAAVLIVAVLAATVRISLPFLVIHYLNRQLDSLEHYRGHIEDVDLLLIAGRYYIHGINIVRTGGDPSLPLFNAEKVALSLSWDALLHGRIEGSIGIGNGQLNILDGDTPQDRQTGTQERWNELVDSLLPFVINRVEVENGAFHFRNPHSDPPVDIALTDISLLVTNLRNRAVEEDQRMAHFEMESTVEDRARLGIRGNYEWLQNQPDFDLRLQLEELPIEVLNDLLRAYFNIDASGQLTVTAEVKARDGAIDGYLQPLAKNLDILEWNKDADREGDPALVLIWQGALDFITELFENQPQSQFGSRIPISGRIEQVDVNGFSAVLSALYNAFITALDPDYDPPSNADRETDPA